MSDTKRTDARRDEGRLAIVLVVLIGAIIGGSIDDPAWVLGRAALTDFLPFVGAAGALVATLIAKLGLSRWRIHLASAVIVALVLPVVTGRVLDPDAAPLDAYRLTATATVNAWIDLGLLGRTQTVETGHYLLVLGGLVWATGQFVAVSVFRHHRPLDGLVVAGLLLIGNMSLTYRDQLLFLVGFTAAGLLLLVRSHAFEEQRTWTRRRLGDPGDLSARYLRAGGVFIAVAVAGSLVLTDRAASAPLAGAWRGVDRVLVQWGQAIQRFVPAGGAQRPVGVEFDGRQLITGSWPDSDGVAFVASFPTDAPRGLYWRAATYDQFELSSWDRSDSIVRTVLAGESILDQIADAPDPERSDAVTVTVTPQAFGGDLILSPGHAELFAREARLETVGLDRTFVAVRGAGGREYQVTARVWRTGEDGLTASRLRAASEDYPEEIAELYLQIPDGAIGPAADALRAEMIATAASSDPYDLAVAFERHLRRVDKFTYSTNVLDLPCQRIGTVECFAQYRTGYCQFYASTMAILLRAEGIPTRLVQGFLPGTREIDGTETVVNRAAHAWVEVYFPGYGWQPFDPTGGGIAVATGLPEGSAVPEVTPAPSRNPAASLDPNERDQEGPERDPGSAGGTTTGSGDSSGLAAVAVLLAAVVGTLIAFAWWRGPRGELSPESAWQGIGALAARFGFGPRPTQTIYEYAGRLGELVPGAKPDLQTVAQARVEVAYARHVLGGDRLARVRSAARRLRVTLLRLAFRRRSRGVRRIRL